MLRLGDSNQALEALASIKDEELSHRDRGEVLTLRGAALTLGRRFNEAVETLDLARVYAISSTSAELEADFEFCSSTLHFATHDLEKADTAAQRVFEVNPDFSARGGYFVPLAHTRGRAYNMRGVVAATREDFDAQLLYAWKTVAELQNGPHHDTWFWAAALMQLAFQVRDRDLVDDARFLRGAIAQARWAPEMARMTFEIHRALGWSSALRGDHLAAFRSFRQCLGVAPTVAWKVIACVDRASLSRELHERYSAHEEIENAATLAEDVDWSEVGEERVGLAQLAEELASFDPMRAASTLARYRAIKTKLTPYALHNFLRRPRAYECMAAGAIAVALQERSAAEVHFLGAFKIFDDFGHGWLAARAAIELAEIGAGERFKIYAAREAALRPQSWLARRVAALM